MSIKTATRNMFKKSVPTSRVGQVLSKSGTRYTLKDTHERRFFAFSTESYSIDEWLQVEGDSIIARVAQPTETKIVKI